MPDTIFYYSDRSPTTSADTIITSSSRAVGTTNTLTSVDISSSVTGIASIAFQSCTGLNSINFPNSIISIGGGAFYGCTSLTNITLSDSITSVGNNAFQGCSNLENVIMSNNMTVLPDAMFNRCVKLKNIKIGDNIETIGGGAFFECNSALKEIVIPKKVNTIGNNAFFNCDLLNKMYFLGNAPTNIGVTIFGASSLNIYRYPNKTGWSSTFQGQPVFIFYPSKKSSRIFSTSNVGAGKISINKKNLGNGRLLVSPFTPKSISGLSLWLSADDGVVSIPEFFVNQIILTEAGQSSSNGTYVRSNGGKTSFSGPNGNYIYWDGDNEAWTLSDATYEGDTYANYSFTFESNWTSLNFSKPPSAFYLYSESGRLLVQSWIDKSQNKNNATPVSNYPVYNDSDLNGKPTISLTSMSDDIERVFTLGANPLGAVGSTAFSVQYVEDVCNQLNDNGPIFGNFGAAVNGTHYPYGLNCEIYDSFATADRKDNLISPDTITNTWSIYSVKSTDNDWESFINGLSVYSDPSNVYNNSIGGEDGTLYIGKQTSNGNHAIKGKVAEVLIYNRVLTTQERKLIEAYLSNKYAIY